MARDCVRPMYCCICKSGTHLAYICPFSWHRVRVTSEEAQEINLEEIGDEIEDMSAGEMSDNSAEAEENQRSPA